MMASDTKQHADALTRASPSKLRNRRPVKQRNQHTRHRDTESERVARRKAAATLVMCGRNTRGVDGGGLYFCRASPARHRPAQPAGATRWDRQRALRSLCLCVSVAKRFGRDVSVILNLAADAV